LVRAGAKVVATCATARQAVDCLDEKSIDAAVSTSYWLTAQAKHCKQN
jgi:hypothetical protein